MGKKDKRIGYYITNAPGYAKPILKHIREMVHKACPEVEETMKWSFPHFDYKGMMCSMAAFKQHCAFSFWKAALMAESGKLRANNQEAMGHLGLITSLADLPDDKKMIEWIKEAMKLNDTGVKLPPRKKVIVSEPIEIPLYFSVELKKNKKAQLSFENFSPSNKREYIQWIKEAKNEETRNKRMITALEWLSEGKSRNWKYERP